MATIEWHGTQAEGQALLKAIASNCTCEFGLMGARISTCPPHAAFTSDQRFVDGLVFERRWMTVHFPDAGNRVIRG